MIELLPLLLALAGDAGTPSEVPPALTEVVPSLALRWRSLPLDRAGGRVATLTAGTQAIVAASASAVLRVRGAFTAGCAPLATRVFGTDGARAEVPLPPPARSGSDLLVVMPPALAPQPGRADEAAPATLGLALPAGCAPVAVQVFEAANERDPDAGVLVAAELRRLLESAPGEEALARWLAAPHAHRWQEQAALAMALPRLLGPGPGRLALARGLLALATADLRTGDLASSVRGDLTGSAGAGQAIPAGGHLELDVRGAEVVRLSHRAEARGAAPLAWRLAAAFDGAPATWLLAHASADPERPGTSRARTRALVVPPGARRLRLEAADGAVFVWAESAHAKAALSELFQQSAAEALAEARRAGGPTGRLAAALLGEPGEADGAPVPSALLEVLRAEQSADAGEANRALRRASDHLRAARTPLERAAAGVVEAMSARVRASRAVAAGRPGEAVSRWLALAAARPLCDEDASELLETDAFAQESLSGSPQALLVADGLLAHRPLDAGLALARQRAFAGAHRWQELSTDPGPREAHFLDPLPAGSTLAAPEHARFLPVPRTGPREVELPEGPLAGRLPLLGIVALRPPGAPAVVRVNVDGTPFTVPAVGPLERVDLPVRPGRHRVELGSAAGGTELLVNWAGGSEPSRRWRRYLELGAQPLELHNRDVGAGDILLVAVRVVGQAGAALPPLVLALEGEGMRPVPITVRPGPLVPGAPGEVDPELGASAPLEALVPVATRNAAFRLALRAGPPGVRVLVHVSARRRASVPPPPAPSPGGPPAREEAPLEAVAALTTRIAQGGPRAPLYLARATALASADEAALAREDLIRSLEGPLDPPARRKALALWRHLDGVGSAAYPETVDARSAWAYAPGNGLVLAAMPADLNALGRLADDRGALRRLGPAALIAAAGGALPGDLGLLAGARQAERDGAWVRAAELWHALAAAHDEAGLQARAAAALLELPPDPLRDVTAYVDLVEATQLDPHDPVASRLLRRAAARTRLRPVHEVDDSAGTVTLAGTPSTDGSVEAALLPDETGRPGELVTNDRQLSLSLDLAAPMSVRLVAQVRELRPAGARALAAAGVALVWVRDGEAAHRVVCPAGETSACRSGPITLPAGTHSLVVRLDGGLRPAARVEVQSACPPGPRSRPPIVRSAEYLLARSEQPVVVTLYGPGAVEVELRPGTSTARRQVTLAVLPAGAAEPSVRRVSLAASSTDASVVETLVLDRAHPYRVEVRPARGEVLCRLRLRDGIGTGTVRPPALPAVLAANGPAPLLAPPDLEHVPRAEVTDGDVAAGWEDAGALATELGWRTSVDVADASEVIDNSARLVSVTYRRLIDRLHLTLKVGGEARFWSTGSPSAAGLLHGYFQHPAARWARLLGTLDGATQSVTGQRASGVEALVMFEPVATLRSGLHLVSKLGLRAHWQSLGALSDERLRSADPDVFNRYAARHTRALFWEEGFEVAPLRDLLFYGGARVTSNPELSLRHPDRVAGMAVARGAIERLTVSAGLRWTQFLAGPDRSRAFTSRTGTLELLYTFWVGHTNALTIAVQGNEHFDLHAPELAVRLGWELSNGRRLRDHTAVEGENYFYPQRGPGREMGRLSVGGL